MFLLGRHVKEFLCTVQHGLCSNALRRQALHSIVLGGSELQQQQIYIYIHIYKKPLWHSGRARAAYNLKVGGLNPGGNIWVSQHRRLSWDHCD